MHHDQATSSSIRTDSFASERTAPGDQPRERSSAAHARSGNPRRAGLGFFALHLSFCARAQSTTRPQILGDAGQASGIDVRINRLEPRVITSQHNLQVSGVVRNLSDKPVTNPSLDAYVQTYSPVTAPELSSYLSGQSWQGRRVHAAPSRQRLLLTPSRPSTSQSHLNLFPSDQILSGDRVESPSLLKAMKLAALIVQSSCGIRVIPLNPLAQMSCSPGPNQRRRLPPIPIRSCPRHR